METTMLLAKLFGPVLLAVGLGFFVSKDYYKKAYADIIKDSGILLLSGFISLPIGILMVTYHNIWSGWEIIITIFGWLALIKGAILFVFPAQSIEFAKSWMKNDTFWNVLPILYFVLGLVLSYYGFLA